MRLEPLCSRDRIWDDQNTSPKTRTLANDEAISAPDRPAVISPHAHPFGVAVTVNIGDRMPENPEPRRRCRRSTTARTRGWRGAARSRHETHHDDDARQQREELRHATSITG